MGVEVGEAALVERGRVHQQPRRQVEGQVAQVPVGEGDARLALEGPSRLEVDAEVHLVGVGADHRGGQVAVLDHRRREAAGAGEEAEARGGCEGAGDGGGVRAVGGDEAEVVGGVGFEAGDCGAGGVVGAVGPRGDRRRGGAGMGGARPLAAVVEVVGGGLPAGVDGAGEQRRDALDVCGAEGARGRRGGTRRGDGEEGRRQDEGGCGDRPPHLRPPRLCLLFPFFFTHLPLRLAKPFLQRFAFFFPFRLWYLTGGLPAPGSSVVRVGSPGGEGSDWQASPCAGERRRGDREAAARARVVEVERAGVGGDQGVVGDEEGVGAVGGGVDEEGSPRRAARGEQRQAAAGLRAAALPLGLPLIDVGDAGAGGVVGVGVGQRQGVARVEEDALAVGWRGRVACRRRWSRGRCRWRSSRGSSRGRWGARWWGCRRGR